MRTREIKPDFHKDEDLAACSHAARLLFVGLWALADRRGRLEDRPLKLKAELFPYEQLDVDPLLDELARPKRFGVGSMLTRYEVDGRRYLQVNNFERHQHPHPKEADSKIPGPPGEAPKGNGKPGKVTARRERKVASPASTSGPSSTSSPSDYPPTPPADAGGPSPRPKPVARPHLETYGLAPSTAEQLCELDEHDASDETGVEARAGPEEQGRESEATDDGRTDERGGTR